MRIRQITFAFIVFMAISGCAISAKVRARNELESSKTAYKSCLQQHPSDPSQCEGLKQAYEADLESFKAMSDALKKENQ
jgi:hypothetical protein